MYRLRFAFSLVLGFSAWSCATSAPTVVSAPGISDRTLTVISQPTESDSPAPPVSPTGLTPTGLTPTDDALTQVSQRTLTVISGTGDSGTSAAVDGQAPVSDRALLRSPLDQGGASSPDTQDRTVRHIEADHDTSFESTPISTTTPAELFICPVENPSVSSPYGIRRDPITRSRQRMHRGVDYRGATGTPVYATASGTALLAGWCDSGTGNCVVIEHAEGWRSQYFHMSEVHIRVGQQVEQGAHIGDIGSTGRSTGPHLHFQVGRDGQAVDPVELMGSTLE